MVAKKPMITRAWWLNNDNICPICDDLRVAKRQNLRQGFNSWHKLLIECSQEWLHSLYAYRKTALIRINLKVLFRGFYLILALLFIFCRTSPLPALSCIRSNLFTNPLNGKMQECRQKNVLFFYISKTLLCALAKATSPSGVAEDMNHCLSLYISTLHPRALWAYIPYVANETAFIYII